MSKLLRRLIPAGVLLLLTAAAVGAALLWPAVWFSFYTDFSRWAMRVLGNVFGWIPFPVWEPALVLLVLAIPAGLVRAIKKKKLLSFLSLLLTVLVILGALFMGLWGLNHLAPTIGEQLALEVRPCSVQELQDAAAWYASQANAYANRVARDADGNVAVPEVSVLSDEAVEAYSHLAEENDRFADPVSRVKPLLVSKAFAYGGTTGVFVCLTGEAGVSTETYSLSLPFTVCHELGHSLAVAREDEANYLAFLACRASENDLFRYSGYYNAYVYCFNALYREDRSKAESLWALCSEQLLHDANTHVAYNKQYKGKVQKAAQAVNNAYLKAFTEAGTKSYGQVVDYLIAEYLKTNNK